MKFIKLSLVLAMLAFGSLVALSTPDVALAGGGGGGNASANFGGVGGIICQVANTLKGNLGKAIATIAIIFLGIGAFFGKTTWGLAVAVGVGIFAIFGASTILAQFTGDDGTCSEATS